MDDKTPNGSWTLRYGRLQKFDRRQFFSSVSRFLITTGFFTFQFSNTQHPTKMKVHDRALFVRTVKSFPVQIMLTFYSLFVLITNKQLPTSSFSCIKNLPCIFLGLIHWRTKQTVTFWLLRLMDGDVSGCVGQLILLINYVIYKNPAFHQLLAIINLTSCFRKHMFPNPASLLINSQKSPRPQPPVDPGEYYNGNCPAINTDHVSSN